MKEGEKDEIGKKRGKKRMWKTENREEKMTRSERNKLRKGI